jgi:anti-anti-sigma regulatory factor
MSPTTTIVTTRIGDCAVIALPEDLSEPSLSRLLEAAQRTATTTIPRSIVFEMSALKFADTTEFRSLMDIADMIAMLGIKPVLAGLNPGIITHLINANLQIGSLQFFLDLAEALMHLGVVAIEGET